LTFEIIKFIANMERNSLSRKETPRQSGEFRPVAQTYEYDSSGTALEGSILLISRDINAQRNNNNNGFWKECLCNTNLPLPKPSNKNTKTINIATMEEAFMDAILKVSSFERRNIEKTKSSTKLNFTLPF
jgi:hypothetical protein